jgi:dTDP-4-dehydrorhamnose 3,5-epimerase
MNFIPTKFKDAWIIEPKVFCDERGFFYESYSKKVFAEKGVEADFVQDNHSLSVKLGVLRGLHFQTPPMAQAKLVRVTRGKVYDAIVDLRKDSETFGQWQGFELSAENNRMLYVPRGFAHGFVTLEDGTEFLYKCDNYYSPEHDGGLIWNDPDLAIGWPIKDVILSEKDSKHPKFKDFNPPF